MNSPGDHGELEQAARPNFVGNRFFLNKLSSNAAAEADRIAQSSPLRPGMQAVMRPEELRPAQLIALAQAVHERVQRGMDIEELRRLAVSSTILDPLGKGRSLRVLIPDNAPGA